VSLIPVLKTPRYPRHIAGLVMAVGVFALQLVTVGAWAEVGKELSEVVLPLVAHADSSATVSVPHPALRPIASIPGTAPSLILACETPTGGMTVCRGSSFQHLQFYATATSRVTFREVRSKRCVNRVTAIANAIPIRPPIAWSCDSCSDSETVEAASGQIIKGRHSESHWIIARHHPTDVLVGLAAGVGAAYLFPCGE